MGQHWQPWHERARRVHAQPAQLQAWYEAATGHPVPHLDWVQGLIRYKSAAVAALLAKNASKRGEPGDYVERRRRSVRGTLEWALEILP